MEDDAPIERALYERSQKGVGLAPYLAAASGQVMDGISTLHAFNHGAHETNPMIGQSSGKLIALKAGTAAGTMLLMKKLAEQGHPTAAKILGYSLGAFGNGLAMHNFNAVKGR